MTIADLKWCSSRMFRTEPTELFTVNRNGHRVPVTKGAEYVQTAGMGTLPLEEWYSLMEQAVKEEGQQELLEKIEAHCRTKCAWIRTDPGVHKYALECLSDRAYEAWWKEKEGE